MTLTSPGKIESKRIWAIFEGVTELFRPEQAGNEECISSTADHNTYENVTVQLENAMSELHSRMQARREEAEARRRAQFPAASGQAKGRESEEQREQRIKIAHREIRDDIMALHSKLGTSLTPELYEELIEFAEAAAQQMGQLYAGNLLERTRAAAMRRVFNETGPLAWDYLNLLMGQAGISWGDPGGLPPGLLGEELETARRRRVEEIEDLFLTTRPSALPKLLVGQVQAWKSDYPERGSTAWQQLALRVVGPAGRTWLLKQAVEKLKIEAEDIKAEARDLLNAELSMMHQLLDSGLDSIEHADQVVAGASSLLSEVIPEMCWRRVEPMILEIIENAKSSR